MNFFLLLPYYFRWHYSYGLKDFFGNLKLIISFVFRFFSVAVLAKTLFLPWRRLSESYAKGFDPGAFFSTFIVNSLMRIVGFVIRGFVLIFGLLSTFASAVISLFALIIWVLLPLLLVFLFVLALKEFLS